MNFCCLATGRIIQIVPYVFHKLAKYVQYRRLYSGGENVLDKISTNTWFLQKIQLKLNVILQHGMDIHHYILHHNSLTDIETKISHAKFQPTGID